MIELRIEGLACKGCVSSVERAIAAADPAAKTEIDLDSGHARIGVHLSGGILDV